MKLNNEKNSTKLIQYQKKLRPYLFMRFVCLYIKIRESKTY